MKKISFGSFPLVDISIRERYCLDSYLIKSFADKIAISTTLGTISRSEQIFITPTLIRKYFKNELYENSILWQQELLEEASNKNKNKNNNQNGNNNNNNNNNQNKNGNKNNKLVDLEKLSPKLNANQLRLQRAFIALKNLNANLINDPFYQHNINFPIYIEDVNASGIPTSYDFLLLTNDLLNKSAINEINYSDNIILIILFLKVIIAPNIRLCDLRSGDANSNTFRSELTKVIEFSQQKGTNPISLMFMLLVSVSMAKKQTKGASAGLLQSTKNYISNAFGAKTGATLKLFDDTYSHTKSVSELLHSISFDRIQKFFDDTSTSNPDIDAKHTGYVPNSVAETGAYADPIFRQYMMQKTEQYNSVLSLVNALYEFNENNKLYTDVSNSETLTIKNLSMDPEGNAADTTLNQDDIIQLIDNEAMPCFMTRLRNEINTELNKAFIQFSAKFNTKLKSKYNKGDDLSTFSIKELQAEIAKHTAELQKATPADKANINAIITNLWKQIQLKTIFGSMTAENEKAIKQIDLEFNLRTIQNDLTDLYSNTIIKFMDEATLSNVYSNLDEKALPAVLNSLQQNIESISQSVTNGIRDQIKNALINSIQSEVNLNINNASNGPLSILMSTFTKQGDNYEITIAAAIADLEKSIDSYTPSRFDESLRKFFTDCIYKRVSSLLLSKKDVSLAMLKQAQNEKNPILKKLSNESSAKKFKSYILTDKLLLDLYNIVYFYDKQRYISGLINTPPSTKLLDENNQIKYILKRIGLDENVVFITSNRDAVTLQMPDFLSLTGIPLFEKVTATELKDRCSINWNKDVWDNPAFGQMKPKADPAAIKQRINGINDEITRITKQISMTSDDKQKYTLNNRLDQLRADLNNKKDELDNANNSSKTMGVENLTIRPKLAPGKHEDEFDTITGNQKPSLGISGVPGANPYGQNSTYGSQSPAQSVVDRNIDAVAKDVSTPTLPGTQDRNPFNRSGDRNERYNQSNQSGFSNQNNQSGFNNRYTNNASNVTSRNPYNR